MHPGSIAAQDYANAHDLAVAYSQHWEEGIAQVSGTAAAELAAWLRERGESRYPLGELEDEPSPEFAPVRLLRFLALFAPEVPPTLFGQPADVVGLARLCRLAISGDLKAARIVGWLRAETLEQLARHGCRAPDHPDCDSGGCRLLGQLWPRYAQMEARLRELLAGSSGKEIPGLDHLRPYLFLTLLDDSYRPGLDEWQAVSMRSRSQRDFLVKVREQIALSDGDDRRALAVLHNWAAVSWAVAEDGADRLAAADAQVVRANRRSIAAVALAVPGLLTLVGAASAIADAPHEPDVSMYILSATYAVAGVGLGLFGRWGYGGGAVAGGLVLYLLTYGGIITAGLSWLRWPLGAVLIVLAATLRIMAVGHLWRKVPPGEHY